MEFTEHYNNPTLRMSREFQHTLEECAWPGNIRQLRSVMEHAVLVAQGPELATQDLPDDILASRVGSPYKSLTPEVIRAALKRCNDNRSHAAELLGIGRTTLWRAMKEHGIE